MFLKARHWLGVMLLALVVQIGNLAKVGIRKGYDRKYENERKIHKKENSFQSGQESNLNGPSRLTVDELTKYQLGLTGKFEPPSDLPTVNLLDNSDLEHSSRYSTTPRCSPCTP